MGEFHLREDHAIQQAVIFVNGPLQLRDLEMVARLLDDLALAVLFQQNQPVRLRDVVLELVARQAFARPFDGQGRLLPRVSSGASPSGMPHQGGPS